MRSTFAILAALLGLAGPHPGHAQPSRVDTPIGDLSCRAAVRLNESSEGAVFCVFRPLDGEPEAVYAGSLKTELADDVAGTQQTHWVVRGEQGIPLSSAIIGQTFTGGGGLSDGHLRTLNGQNDDRIRLELDPLSIQGNPKWTTAVMVLGLSRAEV